MVGSKRRWLAKVNSRAGLLMVMHSISKGVMDEFHFPIEHMQS
jgi:hypothetical protein